MCLLPITITITCTHIHTHTYACVFPLDLLLHFFLVHLYNVIDPKNVVGLEELVGADLGRVLDEPTDNAVDPHVQRELLGPQAGEADGGHAVGGGVGPDVGLCVCVCVCVCE